MSKYSVELKWAGIFALVTILWMLLEKTVGLHGKFIQWHPIYTNLFLIPAITVYVMAFSEKKAVSYPAGMAFREGMITGIVMTVIVAMLSPLVQYISLVLISPEFFPNVIRYSVDHGLMSQEDAENYFNLKSYCIQGIFGTLVIGIVTSAVIAYRMDKKRKK